MSNEATNPSKLLEVQHRGSLSALGAEPCDVGTGDKSPTKSDPDGVPLMCRGLNAQVAGVVKVDMVDGSIGAVLFVVQGNNGIAVTKVYQNGTDAALQGKLAFLY